MTHFMGTFTGKLDRKGRVSVPAAFRAALERLGTQDIILRLSHRDACVEAWPQPVFETMAAGLEQLDVFSDNLDDLSLSLFADAYPLKPDGEGRVVLPEDLIAHAGLTEAVTFLGTGRSFQLWEPEAARRRVEAARQRARERGLTVPATAGGRA
ncbi:division/cell wall cluster transcriptional repressor MraZ [Roseomonas indoligenes]|uniref:Transcriptional regulator MraZ n=1 Tax=Roseomonas indoligenes TaxID=2820811 RepID=A0A940MXK4_9PROT|nr:division/cell wall cluster transcriptional repressor MraZ [Pararoseomonas indoligenes]MBP0493538.1 division/cell wall cluster transcriptional repressor MraZ [Pararoseomonas indoligenes]